MRNIQKIGRRHKEVRRDKDKEEEEEEKENKMYTETRKKRGRRRRGEGCKDRMKEFVPCLVFLRMPWEKHKNAVFSFLSTTQTPLCLF